MISEMWKLFLEVHLAGYNAMRTIKDQLELVINGLMIDVQNLIEALAASRPLFHSEADFQHAFAWELHLRFPESYTRLERPIDTSLGLLHIDVTAECKGQLHVFELKYKTRALVTQYESEIYALQNHGAQPPGRYDFLKDLTRLESVVQDFPQSLAHAVLLTNDSAYWSECRTANDTSAAFSLCDGRICTGSLDWSLGTSAGTKRTREQPINLRGKYTLQWRDYSQIKAKYYSKFRYLLVEVTRPQPT